MGIPSPLNVCTKHFQEITTNDGDIVSTDRGNITPCKKMGKGENGK